MVKVDTNNNFRQDEDVGQVVQNCPTCGKKCKKNKFKCKIEDLELNFCNKNCYINHKTQTRQSTNNKTEYYNCSYCDKIVKRGKSILCDLCRS